MRVLIIASHPDDEILGCGGVIQWHDKQRDNVYIKIFSKGRKDPRDQKLDAELLVTLIGEIEVIVKKEKPELIYTHHKNDSNLDHRLIFEATKIACRPGKSSVREIRCFNNNHYPFDEFHPNVFIPLTKEQMLTKVDNMQNMYPNEIENVPHPRNPKGIVTVAEFYAMQLAVPGIDYVEAFESILRIV